MIVLVAPDEAGLRALFARATAADLPARLFEDENAEGKASLTCLGLGPLDRAEALPITEGLPLMK